MDPYEDIINLPHHVSPKRPQMSMQDRAAQFSPFAALTGYEDAIKETGRLTDVKIELSDEDRELLDQKQQYLQEHKGDPVRKLPLLTLFQTRRSPVEPISVYRAE